MKETTDSYTFKINMRTFNDQYAFLTLTVVIN